MARRKPIKTFDDARAALREIGGPDCRVYVSQSLQERVAPGRRSECVRWYGSVTVMEESSQLLEVDAGADSPAELVQKLSVAVRNELTARAQRRKLSHQQRGLPTPPVLCLGFQP